MEIESIINSVKSYDPNVNWNQILKAYEFSKKLHSRQIRASGDPYLEHPIQVAKLLTEIKLWDNNGQYIEITFDNTILNSSLSDASFEFSIPNGTDVFDHT